MDKRPASKSMALQVTHGEARADSRLIVVELQNQHKNVIELIDRYVDKFKGFGLVAFKTEAVKTEGARGTKHVKFALLNEDQCFFLLSLSRNTDHVVDLKAKLVKAFSEARRAAVQHGTEYLPGYHDLHDQVHVLAANSSNERFVHMNLNKLVNKAAGIGPGQRSGLPLRAQSLVCVAQAVAAQAMRAAQDHHDGYARAKAALATLQSLAIEGGAA